MLAAILMAILPAALPPDQLVLSPEAALAAKNVLFVDTRPDAAYEAGHIAGAAHLAPETLSETRNGVHGLLKPYKKTLELIGAAGLDPTRHVIAYANTHNADDLKDAARLFWALEYAGFEKVSVLDGGYAQWASEGRAVEKGAAKPTAIDSRSWGLSPDTKRLATHAQVIDAVRSGDAQLMDMRTPAQYAGIEKKDIIPVAGHIPGAFNLPVADLVQDAKAGKPAEGCVLKPNDALKAALAQKAEMDAKTPVITYCNTGRDASAGYLAFRRAGFENVAVYDGSMSEWSSHQPLEVKEKK